MKTDYTYCLNQDTCIHRRGCMRWVGNYNEDEVIEESNTNIIGYIDESKCIPNLKDVDCENDYGMLDRFRLSTGEPFKKDKEW